MHQSLTPLPCSCQQPLTRVLGGELAAWQSCWCGAGGRRGLAVFQIPTADVRCIWRGIGIVLQLSALSPKFSLSLKHNTDPAGEATESRSTTRWEFCFLLTKAQLDMEKLWSDNSRVSGTTTEVCGLWMYWTWFMWCENWRKNGR